jgi:small subunit ribosomal protein S6e
VPDYLLLISDPTTGKTRQVEVKDPVARALTGLKIGDILDGSLLGIQGKLRITGGSDIAGIPMRPDVMGPGKRYVLLSGPPGYHPPTRGMRRRKLVRGNVITEDIRQINTTLVVGSEGAEAEAPVRGAAKPVKPGKEKEPKEGAKTKRRAKPPKERAQSTRPEEAQAAQAPTAQQRV